MLTKHKQFSSLENTKKFKFNPYNTITERSLFLGD